VTVPPVLIVRLKSHFHSLPFGVDLIIGLNGYIWVSKTVAKTLNADGEEVGFGEESGEGVYSGQNEVRPTPHLSHALTKTIATDPSFNPAGHSGLDPTGN